MLNGFRNYRTYSYICSRYENGTITDVDKTINLYNTIN